MSIEARTRRFGVELECCVRDTRTNHANIRPRLYYESTPLTTGPDGWGTKSDSSIQSGYDRFAAEIISPPLRGEDGLTEAFYIAEYLTAGGRATANESCGLHVHVDAGGLTEDDLISIVREFHRYEACFFGVAGRYYPVRIRSRYASPSQGWYIPTRDWTRMALNRYQSLNLTNARPGQSGVDKNTVEIRCFAGTVDPRSVATAVYMAVALVVDAVNYFRENGEMPDDTPLLDPEEAAEDFIANVLANPTNRIIPEEPVDDLAAYILAQCQDAARADRETTYAAVDAALDAVEAANRARYAAAADAYGRR